MSSYNHVVLCGHTTKDVELRYTPSGTAVGDVSLAVNRTWKNEAGEKVEEVSFFRCVAFGKTAETLSQYVKKGHAILLDGRLKQERFVDKTTGQNREAVKIVIGSFTFLNQSDRAGKAQPADQDDGPTDRPAKAPAEPASKAPAPYDDQSDVPF